jgi:hypothetical protein
LNVSTCFAWNAHDGALDIDSRAFDAVCVERVTVEFFHHIPAHY